MNIETLNRVDPFEFAKRRGAIAALDAAARAIDGHDALGDVIWRDLEAPGAESVGFLMDERAYVHIARTASDPYEMRLSATAAVAERRISRHWVAGTIRMPDARDRETTALLLDAAVAHVRTRGGGLLECWVFGATESDDAAFAAAGYVTARELFEMRVALPLAESATWPAGITVRPFEPGADNAEWLQVNNRSFAGHPDQGGWTPATLEARMAEPWFDPSLFLLAVDPDGIAGFDWLKVHAPAAPDPALGEIYVIGADPRAQGTGLGRALAIAGLHAVHERGVGTGMLFCAADNTAALKLYRSLGFGVHRTDRAYTREVAAA